MSAMSMVMLEALKKLPIRILEFSKEVHKRQTGSAQGEVLEMPLKALDHSNQG